MNWARRPTNQAVSPFRPTCALGESWEGEGEGDLLLPACLAGTPGLFGTAAAVARGEVRGWNQGLGGLRCEWVKFGGVGGVE